MSTHSSDESVDHSLTNASTTSASYGDGRVIKCEPSLSYDEQVQSL